MPNHATSTDDERSPSPEHRPSLLGFWVAAIASALVDLASKSIVFEMLAEKRPQQIEIIPTYLRLSLHVNEGAVLGFGSSAPTLLLLVTALIVPTVVLMAYSCRVPGAPLWALGLLLGGAAGNLYDRMLSSAFVVDQDRIIRGVRDFLDLGLSETVRYPVFNVADIAIVVGVVVYLIWSLVFAPPEPKKDDPTESRENAAPRDRRF